MSFPSDLTPDGPDDLYLLCQELLEAADIATSTTRGGPISRVFVSAGPPPIDCVEGGMLSVHAGGPSLADTLPLQPPLQPAHRVQMGLQLNLVSVTLTVVRCAAVMQGQTATFPSAMAMSEVAAITMADCWAIWNAVAWMKRRGEIFPPIQEREIYFDPAFIVQTSGGAAGWQIPFRIQLDGFRFGT